MRRRTLTLVGVASFVSGLVLATVGATAHTAGTYYGKKWYSGTFNGRVEDTIVEWRFVETVPAMGERAAIKRGADDWNQNSSGVPYTTMQFNFESAAADYNQHRTGYSPDYQQNKIGWKSYGDDTDVSTSAGPETETLGLAESCFIDTHMFNFKIMFNRDYNWYVGTDPVPADKWDLWSVAAQEFGHATGFNKGGSTEDPGHWGENWDLCPNPGEANSDYRHSLCPFVYKSNKAMRNLEEHDVDTFKNAYQ